MLERVRSEGLLQPGRECIVLLSGGRDSVCLLDLAVTVSGAERVTALHLNYGLRVAAERDQQHCERLCRDLGVRLRAQRPTRPPGGNLQAWARNERYAAAAGLLAGREEVAVATGHTAGDQLETVLYRLISSPSRRALQAMKPRDSLAVQARSGDLGRRATVTVIRPLLGFSRAQTGDYCRQRGLSWVDDESNEQPKYVRNRIRNELLPLLRELHPGAERNIAALAETLRDEQRVLDEAVDTVLGGRAEIELVRLRGLTPALARLVLQRLADGVHLRPAPGVVGRLDEVLALPLNGTGHLDLPHRLRATVTGGVLRVTETDAKPRDKP